MSRVKIKLGDWSVRFGAKRRASDRLLLQELERKLAREEADSAWLKRRVEKLERHVTPNEAEAEESRARIAAAFGRPLLVDPARTISLTEGIFLREP